MAEIKIVGNIERVTKVNRFNEIDLKLISSRNEKNNFGFPNDYIEYHIYDINETLLSSNYNYTTYKSSPNTKLNVNGTLNVIEIDPVKDLQLFGYSTGEFIVQYNFFRRKLIDDLEDLYIKEISSDRTEIKISSVSLNNSQIESKVNEILNEIEKANYFKTYLINFGLNQQFVVVNVALDRREDQYGILLKLYEPLPDLYSTKFTLSFSDEIIEPYNFELNLDKLIIPDALPRLKGPNFNIELPDKNNVVTQYQNYNQLINSNNSSYYQLLSFITSQSIDINIDYTNYDNFIKFSNAYNRVANFYNKVKNIENNRNFINQYIPFVSTTASLTTQLNLASQSIEETIANFDGYEYYLYFESNSFAWPKTNNTKPYVLSSTSSINAQTWLSNNLESASLYDDNNFESLLNVVPSYLREDSNNQQYFTFVNMIGHYFDNIWIYLKSVTDLYKSYNNQEEGVSKDLVYYSLKSLGLKTYNSKEDEELLKYIIGNNSGSANFDDNFTSTGSYLNNIPRQELLAETFKRLYHNVVLLFKSKGTNYGLDNITNIFGVSSSILNVKEYGGDYKSNYLKGYNNDKIIIESSSIFENTLSPFISVVNYTTSSALFRNNDIHRLDISFSPQNQIDNVISSSLASFNIDDYIGDPRTAYSSSYSNLNNLAQTTFNSNFTTQFDYSGFIRLIKYFDNSLFKTISDFVPGRSNLSTGITIRSPQIERNKVKQLKPLVLNETVYEATYSIADISEDKSYLYPYLGGDKSAFYTGEIPISMSSVNTYFISGNYNPYALTSNIVRLPSITGSNIYSFNDGNIFEHTDFNVLLNNVSSSIKSTNRKLLDAIYSYYNNSLVLSGYSSSYFAELQDSYNHLYSHISVRYDGVKVSSLKYNTYSTASEVYIGDDSFGKTAAIDKQVEKIGLFSQIVESIFLPNRNTVRLKYLVNQEGDLTELNQRNQNWCEVQRSFISSEILDVSLFDNQKYGNQKLTDGTKQIFDSGYYYYPILYFSTCSVDPTLYFENLSGNNAYRSVAKNALTPNGFITGSASNTYLLQSSSIRNIFDQIIEGAEYFETGTLSNFPVYTSEESGQYVVNLNLPITIDIPENNIQVWELSLNKVDLFTSESLITSQQLTFNTNAGGTVYELSAIYSGGDFQYDLDKAFPYNITISTALAYGYSTCGDTRPDNGEISTNASTVVLTSGNLSASGPSDYTLTTPQYKVHRIKLSINGSTYTITSLSIAALPPYTQTLNLGGGITLNVTLDSTC